MFDTNKDFTISNAGLYFMKSNKIYQYFNAWTAIQATF